MDTSQPRVDSVFSSSLSPIPSSLPVSSNNLIRPAFRRVQELPTELVQHLSTYFEEDLNAQGFDFSSTLTSNSVASSRASGNILVPPPVHLALAATLSVHPNTTSRTEDASRKAASTSALKLLRLILRLSGPYAPFSRAFRFTKYQSNFFHVRVKKEDESSLADVVTKYDYTAKNSLFNRAEDFWSVIGWAFNCACLPDMHAVRWLYYGPFLEFFLNVLELDWNHHNEQDTPEETLIWTFIELASGGFTRSRRIVRAIFADGSARSLNEFHAIFSKELNPPKKAKDEMPTSNPTLDIDNYEFGDYQAPSSDDFSEDDASPARPSKRVRTRSNRSCTSSARASNESLNSAYQTSGSTGPTTTLGPPQALALRTRLLNLLAQIAATPSLTAQSPTTFVDETELYLLCVEFINPLQLHLFTPLILPNTPASSPLTTTTHTALCEAILERTLESKAPRQASWQTPITFARLVECYLPFAASGSKVESQTKVALLIEALARLATENHALPTIDSDAAETELAGVLAWAAEHGIKARENLATEALDARRARKDKKKKGAEDDDDVAWRLLRESGLRLRALLRDL
jgi:hypothetical protein